MHVKLLCHFPSRAFYIIYKLSKGCPGIETVTTVGALRFGSIIKNEKLIALKSLKAAGRNV